MTRPLLLDDAVAAILTAHAEARGLLVAPEVAVADALERGTRAVSWDTYRAGLLAARSSSPSEDLERAALTLGLKRGVSGVHTPPRREPLPGTRELEPAPVSHHPDDPGRSRPATPAPSAARFVPVPSCNAPGTLGRHPLEHHPDRPTSCPCGRVRRTPARP